ncbi:MAG: tRNA (adenosine(37)-N6)-threonylcarbamoyltransferase complex transferase subunit TsaD [Candidatus Marinimicrobia bacterium]|nr:tRNA (adenosine(37)-N6)-threonylcarbamoyltransferase complex transferase subunit TsaD [Candidatus Neomarinimicrobiota bacterium]MBF89397.1 tRNA (adenosine(37)-N6)-threonylcarbamoyltransferase complex transferase subunit TsaD [Candidatus Neomarinimicrobiota bacterium]|tara:strand:+ start:16394 stop:17386 length:993 start_codon:yes stop_codon:yes gene_type:complete
MIILGIETSCDETAAAVCKDGEILSSVIASQEQHSMYGGVVPEIASRAHERLILKTVEEAINRSSYNKGQLEGIAVTRGPGLMGSLLTGVSFARGLSLGLKIPFIGINHMEAHIFANFIAYPKLKFPFLCLLVSGGHTQIWKVEEIGEYELIGETRDDAAGEAFDKGARILGLGYPGGIAIEKAAIGGNKEAVNFPRAFFQSNLVEFSFSGLKTALQRHVELIDGKLTTEMLCDIAASYQFAIVDILLSKLRLAIDMTKINVALIGGGVAANKLLREKAKRDFNDSKILYPNIELCTDNAAMIAFLGEIYLDQKLSHFETHKVIPNLRLS